jgi:hypothetical protein
MEEKPYLRSGELADLSGISLDERRQNPDDNRDDRKGHACHPNVE